MLWPRLRASDVPLSLILAAAGVLAMAFASHQSRAAFAMLPALDGVVTVAVAATALLLLEGIAYRRALAWMAPILALELAFVRAHGAPLVAGIGIELTIVGVAGLVFGARLPVADHEAASAHRAASPAPIAAE